MQKLKENSWFFVFAYFNRENYTVENIEKKYIK